MSTGLIGDNRGADGDCKPAKLGKSVPICKMGVAITLWPAPVKVAVVTQVDGSVWTAS